ncbi:Transcription factor PDR1 like protein [Verticillium longisporum]|uniref:Transcription factor PDR1 like protein n=1 Tax=Verticillium longisporum TaxID=100787 RepID=A0A8I2Z3A3_VERLO|nr:Transcription factor PDR1 like protein [Verticillium longisporum]
MDTDRRTSLVSNNDSGLGPHGHDHSDPEDHESPPSKQRKPPHVRSRASRACDRCKARKTRCSGKYPCALCSRLRLECKGQAV